MTEASHAVFLSYASQDAEAAQKICEALRAAGIEVWFDQSELRGGDVWDLKIHQQIQDCALFIPIISTNTASRPEGYFRLEWALADNRTQRFARNKAFVVPVCLDQTPDSGADVPESFHRAQWTRLPDGQVPASFCNRISTLLGRATPAPPPQSSQSSSQQPTPKRATGRGPMLAAATALVVVGVAMIALQVGRLKAPRSELLPAPADSSTIATTAPQKSIAVLPFLDMSEKKDQEYFSDGLSEQLIDLLTKIPALRVPARTSSFYFKGKPEDIATIAARLHVSHVLEGSVRKSGNKLRVTAQLIRADNGYHVWSETYDRKWDDVFKVQDDIAAAVVKALSVQLLGGSVPQSARTSDSAAYTLYLQARAAMRAANSLDDDRRSLGLLEQAIRLDPNFAPAWALLSRLRVSSYEDYKTPSFQSVRAAAHREAQRAIALDGALAEGHLALSRVFMIMDWSWGEADHEMQTALQLEGNNPDVLRNAFYLYRSEGRFDKALQTIHAATEADPLYFFNSAMLGQAHFLLRQYAEALTSCRRALDLYPGATFVHYEAAFVQMALGQPGAALAENALESDAMYRANGLPQVLDALGRTHEADQARADFIRKFGGPHPHYAALMFAAHGDLDQAFIWWDRALQQHDTDLPRVKMAPAYALMPQLAADPRFKTLLRKMNLPET